MTKTMELAKALAENEKLRAENEKLREELREALKELAAVQQFSDYLAGADR